MRFKIFAILLLCHPLYYLSNCKQSESSMIKHNKESKLKTTILKETTELTKDEDRLVQPENKIKEAILELPKRKETTPINESQSIHKENDESKEKELLPKKLPVLPNLTQRTHEDSFEDEYFFYKKNIKCSLSNCSPPNFCIDATTCRCGEGRANFSQEGEKLKVFCEYKQKKQVVALLLEFFLALGVGHFYCGRTVFGIIKLSVTLFPFCLCCFMLCGSKLFESAQSGAILIASVFECLSCCFILAVFVWWIVDIIMFGMNMYKDGNGVPLQSW